MCRPEIAKLNSEYIGYETPNEEAKKLLDDDHVERAYKSRKDQCSVCIVQTICSVYDERGNHTAAEEHCYDDQIHDKVPSPEVLLGERISKGQ